MGGRAYYSSGLEMGRTDSTRLTTIVEYLGPFNVDADTLRPNPFISDEARAFADQHFDPNRYLAWYSFILRDFYPGDSGGLPMILWEATSNPFTHDSAFLVDYQNKTQDYYEMIGKYDEFTQGWLDVDPDMIGSTNTFPDSFAYIYNQKFGTDYDHRFKGFAIKTIGTDPDGIPNDTTWLYYHDSTGTRPWFFGYSSRQIEYFSKFENQ